jgi:acetyl esterase
MKYGWDLYAADAKTRDNPYVSPLRASVDQLKGLPPALVITAENDPLRDEGEAYARKLKNAGVTVAAVRYNGMIHDFVLLNAIRNVPATEAAIKQINDGLRQYLEPAGKRYYSATKEYHGCVGYDWLHHLVRLGQIFG